jgi:hypothetical protein
MRKIFASVVIEVWRKLPVGQRQTIIHGVNIWKILLKERYKKNIMVFRSEVLITSESLTQDFGFTEVLETQAHSRLCNCFASASVGPKDKSRFGCY